MAGRRVARRHPGADCVGRDRPGLLDSIAEPGRYRVSIPFEPRVHEVAGRRQMDLSVPPVAGATVRLTSPAPLADLSVSGTALERRDDPAKTATVWQGELDGSGRITANWTDNLSAATTTAATGSSRRIDELLWLRIEPDGIEMDAKYVLGGSGDWPSTLTVIADGRWEPLPAEGSDAADEMETLADGRQSIQVRVPKVTGERREVLLRFRLRDGTQLGRLRVPEISLASLPVETSLAGRLERSVAGMRAVDRGRECRGRDRRLCRRVGDCRRQRVAAVCLGSRRGRRRLEPGRATPAGRVRQPGAAAARRRQGTAPRRVPGRRGAAGKPSLWLVADGSRRPVDPRRHRGTWGPTSSARLGAGVARSE